MFWNWVSWSDLCPSTPTFFPNLREAGLLTSLKVTSEVNNKNSIKQPVEVVGRCYQGVRRRRQGKWTVRSVASSRVTDPRPRPGGRVLLVLQVVNDITVISFLGSQYLFVMAITLYHLSAKNGLNSSSDVPRVTRWLRCWSGGWHFSLLANLDEWCDLRGPETTPYDKLTSRILPDISFSSWRYRSWLCRRPRLNAAMSSW